MPSHALQAALSRRTQDPTTSTRNEAATAAPGANVKSSATAPPDGDLHDRAEFATPDGSPTGPPDRPSHTGDKDDLSLINRANANNSNYSSARGSITASLPPTTSLGTAADCDASKRISVAHSDADLHSNPSRAVSPRSAASQAFGDEPAMGNPVTGGEGASGAFQSAYSGSTVPTQPLEHGNGLEDATVESAGSLQWFPHR